MKNRALYQIALRFPKLVVGITLLLTLLACLLASRLRIENNLTALLPRNFTSIQAFDELQKYFGGLGFLVLGVKGEDPEATSRFSDEFVKRVEQLPLVQFVDYKRPSDFFYQHQFLLMDMPDLQEMQKRLMRGIELQSEGVSPVFNFMMDFADEEDLPDVTFKDLREKFLAKYGYFAKERAVTDEGTFVAFRIKTKSHQQDLDRTNDLINEIKKIEAELNQKKEYQTVKVIYSGDHVQAIQMVHYLQKKMAWVSFVVFSILLVIILVYFRKVSALFLIGLPLFAGIAWTEAMVYLLLGHLNILTGFAAGILAGLGSDYGIYLYKRYLQEREAGATFNDACEAAFKFTGRATYASMLTTVFSFVAMMVSDFKAAFEFGLIGAMGVFLNYGAMMLFLPSWLKLIENWRGAKQKFIGLGVKLENSMVPIYTAIFRPFLPRLVLFGFMVLVAWSCWLIPKNSTIKFEDGRLDNINLGEPSGEDFYGKVANLYGGNLQPTVLIVQDLREEMRVVDAINQEHRLGLADKFPIREFYGLSSFIPRHQGEKKQLLSFIITLLDKINYLPPAQKSKVIDDINHSINAPEITENNLPPSISNVFRSLVDPKVFGVFIIPDFGSRGLTWEWMADFVSGIENLKSKYGVRFKAADNPFMAVEFVGLIQRESSRIFYFVLLGLGLICFLLLRPWQIAALVYVHLVFSLLIYLGAMYLLGYRINTLNIIAFPIVLGTGINSLIHFVLRYLENFDVKLTIKDKLPSVLVCNLTTMVGFGALLYTPSAGLRSLGHASLLGILVFTLVCGLILPRSLTYLAGTSKK